MTPQPFKIRAGRTPQSARASADDNLGRGMELALTIAFFLVLGLLLDHWLGTSPVFTIALLLVAAVGVFTRMKYAYDAAMTQLENERRQRTNPAPAATLEDMA